MSKTNCQTLAQISELSLNAKSDEEAQEVTTQRENHYLKCSHSQCVENLAFLRKEGLFQVSQEEADKILGNKDEDGNEIID